ncbi:MAG: helix-turn-helix domain-containing protein [Thermomicrobiales bacterium]
MSDKGKRSQSLCDNLPGNITQRDSIDFRLADIPDQPELLELVCGEDQGNRFESAACFQCHPNLLSDYTSSVANSFATVNNFSTIEITMKESSLGEMVRARRLQLNWTQEDLAERVGKTQRWVSNLELGNVGQSRIATLKALSATLGIDIEDLVIAAGQATSKHGARAIAQQTPEYDAELPPHLRASFLRVGELSPTGQKKLESFLDDLFALEDFQNTKNARDT